MKRIEVKNSTVTFCDGDGFSGDLANKEEMPRWISPYFMPKRYSRLTLEIVDIRVERLQDITERDARAEGLAPKFRAIYPTGPWQLETAVDQYKGVWNEINAKHGTDWDTNPWVWVIEFKVVGNG